MNYINAKNYGVANPLILLLTFCLLFCPSFLERRRHSSWAVHVFAPGKWLETESQCNATISPAFTVLLIIDVLPWNLASELTCPKGPASVEYETADFFLSSIHGLNLTPSQCTIWAF